MTMLLLWVLCGWVNYGVSMSYLSNRFRISAAEEWEKDRAFVLLLAAAGPLGVPATLIHVEFKYIDLRYMFKWKNPFIEVK